MEARKETGLKPPNKRKGSVERLNREELDALLGAAYKRSGVAGLIIRHEERPTRPGGFSK